MCSTLEVEPGLSPKKALLFLDRPSLISSSLSSLISHCLKVFCDQDPHKVLLGFNSKTHIFFFLSKNDSVMTPNLKSLFSSLSFFSLVY